MLRSNAEVAQCSMLRSNAAFLGSMMGSNAASHGTMMRIDAAIGGSMMRSNAAVGGNMMRSDAAFGGQHAETQRCVRLAWPGGHSWGKPETPDAGRMGGKLRRSLRAKLDPWLEPQTLQEANGWR